MIDVCVIKVGKFANGPANDPRWHGPGYYYGIDKGGPVGPFESHEAAVQHAIASIETPAWAEIGPERRN